MFITLDVLKEDRSNEVSEEHPSNIVAIFVTFVVSRLRMSSIDFRLTRFLNIYSVVSPQIIFPSILKSVHWVCSFQGHSIKPLESFGRSALLGKTPTSAPPAGRSTMQSPSTCHSQVPIKFQPGVASTVVAACAALPPELPEPVSAPISLA